MSHLRFLYYLGLFVFSIYINFFVDSTQRTEGLPLPPETNITENLTQRVESGITEPSEERVSKNINYQVAADKPRRIIIPSLGIDAFVQEVGYDDTQTMNVPQNTNVVGWFNKRAAPGEKGLSIINGHARGREYRGVFGSLKYLQIGDTFQVEMGDYTIKKFVVTDNFSIANTEVGGKLYEHKHDYQLNLITCTGSFLGDQRTFDHRQIVVAKLALKL